MVSDRPTVTRYFRRAFHALPFLSRTVQLIWAAAPKWSAAWVILLLAQGFLPVAIVYWTRPLVDGIAAATRGGVWSPILWPAGFMAAALVLSELLRGATQWVRTVESELVQDHITSLIHEKSLRADLA